MCSQQPLTREIASHFRDRHRLSQRVSQAMNPPLVAMNPPLVAMNPPLVAMNPFKGASQAVKACHRPIKQVIK